MSRTKKSRKPGGAPTAKAKLSKVELAKVEKRVRKKTGKKPGNRQQEAKSVTAADQSNNLKKDPRIGSKKPIELGGSNNRTQNSSSDHKITNSIKNNPEPIAALRSVNQAEVDQSISLSQALANIESDEQLQIIIEKQEEGIALTEDEVEYFNTMMEQHEKISEQLGDEVQKPTSVSSSSEDDLWDKLDNSSFTDSQ